MNPLTMNSKDPSTSVVEAANAVIEYNSLESLIKRMESYENRHRQYIYSTRDWLFEDRSALSEVGKVNYDKLIQIYKTLKSQRDELHSKARRLMELGIRGRLIDQSLNKEINPILANAINASML